MTQEDCLTQLQALAGSQDLTALDQAGEELDAFVAAGPTAPRAAGQALGELQRRFARETAPSKLRADILDLIGDRVTRLLEEGHATTH